MTHCPDQLRTLYQQGRVLPFIGAGVSMSVKWTKDGKTIRGPSWNELVEQAAALLGYTEPELLTFRGSSLQILEYFRSKKGSMQELINWLHLHLQPDDDSLRGSETHKALAQLHQCKTFYTTNYDDFLERSFKLWDRTAFRVASERDMGRTHSDTEIVKFHGDFNTPDRMVMSERDYEKRINLDGDLDLKLRSDALGRAILFLGYSFRDSNVSYLFRRIMDSFGLHPGTGGKRAYILVVEPSDFELSLFQERQIEVIALKGDDIEKQISQFLSDMRR